MVLGQARKNVHETPSLWKKADMVAHTCHPSDSGKHKIGGSWSRQKTKTPAPKQPEQKGWMCGSSGRAPASSTKP
jgi:hypothetical protein